MRVLRTESSHVFGSSKLSSSHANEARDAALSFFRAPPGHTVVFTANATGALKLVGESFPFNGNGTYLLGADSHNSVHGIRQYATRAGAKVCYIERSMAVSWNQPLRYVFFGGYMHSEFTLFTSIGTIISQPTER